MDRRAEIDVLGKCNMRDGDAFCHHEKIGDQTSSEFGTGQFPYRDHTSLRVAGATRLCRQFGFAIEFGLCLDLQP